MTQLTLEAPIGYAWQRKVRRWWKGLTAHAGFVLAFLACYPPYSLNCDPPTSSEWKRYEPASDWLKEHRQADPLRSRA